jgi:hypothetical protein
MDKMISRFQAERFDDQALESRFVDVRAILFRTQNACAERALALAALETLEGERNRRVMRLPALAP